MKKYHLEETDYGWCVWDGGLATHVKDEVGGFVYGPTLEDAVVIMLRHIRKFCSGCDQKLRKSEGDGPCSDCMAEQCKEKDQETAPAAV